MIAAVQTAKEQSLRYTGTQRRAGLAAGTSDGLGLNVMFGLLTVLVLFVGTGLWAATTRISGAVIAAGTVVVESNVKRIQHQTGGTVEQIFVHEGDRVHIGDPLIKFDETSLRANLDIVRKQLDQSVAARARLEAERIGLPAVTFPKSLTDRKDDPEVQTLLLGETSVFQSRLKALEGQKAQLRTRIDQMNEQIEGLESQRQAAIESTATLEDDAKTLKDLYLKKLVPLERMSSLHLQLAQQRGESGRLQAAIAEAKGRISEVEIQIIGLDDQFKREVNSDLREAQDKEAELVERKIVAEDQLTHSLINSPQDGVVQQLNAHTIGGVVGPGETIMLIVPEADKLIVEARVSPSVIDDVAPGQKVRVRFSSFDMPTTPECHGYVDRVSPDLVKEPNSNVSYYVARINVSDQSSCLGSKKTLVPGMPAEVHVQTEQRSVISYLMKPIVDQVTRTFKQ